MSISDLRNFWFFDPKNQKFDFSIVDAQNIHKTDIRKTEIYVIELCVTNSCTKYQANSLIFGCEMVQKPIDGMTSFF